MSCFTRNHVEILPNCVPKAATFVVWGRVITNYKQSVKKANRTTPNGHRERLIAPVMEYHINDGKPIFHRHVKAVIHPAIKLPLNDTKQELRVYLESESEEIEAVERTKDEVEQILREQADYPEEFNEEVKQRLQDTGIFYTIQGDGTIAVFTYHFSLIKCAIVEPAVEEDIKYIRGILTAKLSKTREQKQRLLLEFSVQFVKTSDCTKTYWEVRYYEVLKFKMVTTCFIHKFGSLFA